MPKYYVKIINDLWYDSMIELKLQGKCPHKSQGIKKKKEAEKVTWGYFPALFTHVQLIFSHLFCLFGHNCSNWILAPWLEKGQGYYSFWGPTYRASLRRHLRSTCRGHWNHGRGSKSKCRSQVGQFRDGSLHWLTKLRVRLERGWYLRSSPGKWEEEEEVERRGRVRKHNAYLFSAYHVNRHDVKYQKQSVHLKPTASWHLPGVGFICCCSNYLAQGGWW